MSEIPDTMMDRNNGNPADADLDQLHMRACVLSCLRDSDKTVAGICTYGVKRKCWDFAHATEEISDILHDLLNNGEIEARPSGDAPGETVYSIT